MAAVKMNTPSGELLWVSITGEGKLDLQGRPKYQATVLLSAESAKPLQDKIMEYWEANRPKGIKKPKSTGWYPHTIKTDEIDPETDKAIYKEDPQGRVEFRLKTNTTWPKDNKPVIVKTFKPKLDNGKLVPINLGDKEIGNGSLGSLIGSFDIYTVKSPNGAIMDAGITMYLGGIQLQKFIAYEGSELSGTEMEEVEDDGLGDIELDEAVNDGPTV